jgi:hypothetical protein
LGWPDWLSERVVLFVVKPIVNNIHVAIDGICSERSRTPPTNMGVALRARHMVATPVLLDYDFASWAFLDIPVTISPAIQ